MQFGKTIPRPKRGDVIIKQGALISKLVNVKNNEKFMISIVCELEYYQAFLMLIRKESNNTLDEQGQRTEFNRIYDDLIEHLELIEPYLKDSTIVFPYRIDDIYQSLKNKYPNSYKKIEVILKKYYPLERKTQTKRTKELIKQFHASDDIYKEHQENVIKEFIQLSEDKNIKSDLYDDVQHNSLVSDEDYENIIKELTKLKKI